MSYCSPQYTDYFLSKSYYSQLVTPHLHNENSCVHKTGLRLPFLNVIDMIWHWTEVHSNMLIKGIPEHNKEYILAAVKFILA